jgi:iron complex outermembrane receptor protein
VFGLGLRSFTSATLVAVCFSAVSLRSQGETPPQNPAQTTPQQAETGVDGMVVDGTGAALVGAKVILAQTAGTLRYETVTNATGHYRIPNPATGSYTLTAEATGFHPAASQVTVTEGQGTKVDIRLGFAGSSESVTVTGASDEVFAGKYSTPIEKIPQAVQVITHDDLMNRNVISLGDILAEVPSATPGPPRESTYQGFAFRIRGFTAYPVFNGVYQRYFFLVDPSALANVESVQVVKGPSGVLIGQGEVGGVINITTKTPQHEYSGSASVIGGSYNQASGWFDVTGPVRPVKGLYFRANGEIERSGSFVQYLPINRTNGSFDATWEHSDKVSVHFVGEWQERQTYRNPGLPVIGTVLSNGVATIPRYTFLGDPDTNGDPGHSNFTATGMLLQAWVPIKLNQTWTLTPRVSYSTFTGIYSEINLAAVTSNLTVVGRTGRYDEERHHYPIEQVDLTGSVKTLGANHHLLFGIQNNLYRVDYFQQNMPSVTSINTLNPYPTYGTVADGPYPLSSVAFNNYDSWAVYGQDAIDLTPRLTATVGGRGDFYLAHHSTAPNYTTPATVLDTNFNHVTYQAGATYRLNRGWSLFGGYSTGFNIESTVNSLTYNGAPLSPEVSWQGEGGVHLIEGPVNFTGSLFQINKTNAVTSDPNHPGYSINDGDVRGRGVELEGKWQLMHDLFLEPGYTYEYAEIIKSNSGNQGFQMADTPRNRADLFLRYAPHHFPVQFRGGMNFVGNRAFLDTANVTEGPGVLGSNVQLPQYTTVDLGATYFWSRARFDLNVRNVADRTYYTKDFGSYDVIPGEPREISGRMTYRF